MALLAYSPPDTHTHWSACEHVTQKHAESVARVEAKLKEAHEANAAALVALREAEGERDELREALTRCRAETLEEAALAVEDADNHYPGDYEHGSCFSADRLAETIRALMGKTNE